MFLFNWFRYSEPKKQVDDKALPSETYTIKKDTFDTLLKRIQDLTEQVEVLKKQTEQPQIHPIPNQPLLNMLTDNEIYIPKKKTYPTQPFQDELEKKLLKLREKMGQSHGWGDFPLNNLDDLEKLEQSVMEQSRIFNTGTQIERTHFPINDNTNFCFTPSNTPTLKQK